MSVSPDEIPALERFLQRAGQSDAAARLKAAGLPHRRLEAWRYTPVKTLHTRACNAPAQSGLDSVVPPLNDLPPLLGPVITYLDGVRISGAAPEGLVPQISSQPARSEGVAHESPMGLLNAALRQPGLDLSVPADTDTGMMSLVSRHCCDTAISTHLYHRIALMPGAKLVLLDYSSGQGPYLANPFYEISVGAGAHLAHIRVVEDDRAAESLGVINACVSVDARYESFTLVLGAGLSRQEVYADLEEAGGQVHINGAQLLGTGQVGDLTSVITHNAPHCQSRQTIANVIYGRGRGVFQGKVVVKPHAQKTDGFQMNQALLLSPEAEINSKPELEIYADDVKCSHGATVGALDDAQLFYLRTRGIPEAQAREILVEAFLAEVVALAPSEAVIPFLQARLAASARLRTQS